MHLSRPWADAYAQPRDRSSDLWRAGEPHSKICDYFKQLDRSWIQATSGLFGDGTFRGDRRAFLHGRRGVGIPPALDLFGMAVGKQDARRAAMIAGRVIHNCAAGPRDFRSVWNNASLMLSSRSSIRIPGHRWTRIHDIGVLSVDDVLVLTDIDIEDGSSSSSSTCPDARVGLGAERGHAAVRGTTVDRGGLDVGSDLGEADVGQVERVGVVGVVAAETSLTRTPRYSSPRTSQR